MDRFVASKPAPRRSGPTSSHSIVVASRSIEQQIFNLRSRGVLVTATEARHCANPHLVGQALEKELRLPPHQLRVTRHHPEAFFVLFDTPPHRDRAIAHGRLHVEGSTFLLQAWRESDHAVHIVYNLHARICIERMPMHMWSREGAQEVLGSHVLVDRLDSRTYTQDNTELFSCWVWCRSIDHIPGHHGFSVFPQEAGHVVEMNGYSPPRREVAPPPECLRYDSLIHVDLVEDWTVRESRTPSTGQSGIPSSTSSEEPPYPMVQPFTWRFGIPDGEERSYGGRRQDGCHNIPAYRRRDDEGDSSGQRKIWRDVAAAPARIGAPAADAAGRGGSRHRSRSPAGHRQRATSVPSPSTKIVDELLPPPPPLPTSGPPPQRLIMSTLDAPLPLVIHAAQEHLASPGAPDPLVDMVSTVSPDVPTWGPSGVDPMCFEMEAACAAAVSQPLSFKDCPSAGLPMVPHPWATADFGLSPTDRPEQVACVASQVDDLHIVDAPAPVPLAQEEPVNDFLQMLFKAPPASVLGVSPLNPTSPTTVQPGSPRSTSPAPKRSQRQASSACSIPVAQRATLRLAKEMHVISGEERRTEVAAAGLVERFKEPLTEVDIDGLAKLTRIDRDAVHRAAKQAAAGRATTVAI
jgi:hypothetical protein